jgi:hypothetical protein
MPLFYLIILLICSPAILVGFDFLFMLFTGERFFVNRYKILEILVMAIACTFLLSTLSDGNQCCDGSGIFSPAHSLSVIVLVSLCLLAYFYSSYRNLLAPPVIEVLINCLLLTGIVFNVFVSIQINDWSFWLVGNVPVIMLFILMLVKNHRLALVALEDPVPVEGGTMDRICRGLLYLKPLHKIPVLLILCLPILVVIAGILLLFGQKTDSLVRAFTDTYQHGFSQWDYKCQGVVCGGHFLCTVAAKGHAPLVRPLRYGVRGGKKILCNRQLLVSNAFEEWLQEHVPALHRPVRRHYNRVGALIHRYYGVFDKTWVADGVYILMKPLEWAFVLFLYCFDRQPEKRIARQYTQGL